MLHEAHILLVEDEAPKRNHIEKLVQQLAPGVRISTARSINSALDVLENQPVTLLLLDMSLPTFDVSEQDGGGRPQGFGGIEILRHMVMAEISCPTVIITGYEGFTREGGLTVDLPQLRTELYEEFPTLLRAVLHYNSTLDEWKVVLTKSMREAGLGTDPS